MNDNKTAHMSSEYDGKINATIPNYEYFHSETIDLVKAINPSPRKWLDTGCGTGTFVLNTASFFRDTEFVLADPAKQMLDIAVLKLAGVKNTKIQVLEPISSQNMDFHEDTFDVITAIQAHHYLDRTMREKATANCFRMLKSKGVYVTFENIKPFSEIGIKIGLNRWKHFQVENGKSCDEAEKHVGRFEKEYFPITILEHVDLLKAAGFQTVEVFWTSYMQAGFYAIKD